LPLIAFPVLAFASWVCLVLYYMPALKEGLHLADQIFAALLFVSHLILILVWSFAGPVTAGILSGLAALLVLYMALALKEPWLALQVLSYGGLYLAMVSFLYELQKKANDKRLLKEKLEEDVHLAKEDLVKGAELEKALQRRIERFLDLHQFAETLKGVPTVPELVRRVVDETHSLVSHAEECVLYLLDEQNQRLEPAASDRAFSMEPPDRYGSAFDQWVMRRARPLIIEDAMNDFRFSTVRKESAKILRSVCACPLMTENKVLGVLRASSRSASAFSSDDLHVLDIIASLAAVTLRNRLLYDRMEELAIRDSLTGLYLNRYFQQRLREEIMRADLKSGHFCLMLLDIDHFKKYNDEFGHSAGDLVLKDTARTVQRLIGPADIAARYGGEEFAVLLPNRDMPSSLKLAEAIRSEVEAQKLVLRRVERAVTVSIGLASYPKNAKTPEELIEAADKLLYKAKNQGRNRVCGSS
jgi:diguanylate cyclase (GGDEF)-like protein